MCSIVTSTFPDKKVRYLIQVIVSNVLGKDLFIVKGPLYVIDMPFLPYIILYHTWNQWNLFWKWCLINKCLVYKNVQIDKIKHRLKDHVLSVHSGQGVKNWCHICDKYYRTKNSLNKHMCVYHNKKSFMGIQL